MGVSTKITVEAPDRETAAEAAAAAYARIAEIEEVASDYRPRSELMRLCRDSTPGIWRDVSSDLARLLWVARGVSEQTSGGFDVTVGPAVRLWRTSRQSGKLPDQVVLDQARARIDWRAVEVQLSPPRVRLLKRDMQIDLGGIAKGYAAQEAGRVLAARGRPRCLVALSGDVYAGEAPHGQPGWRVEIAGGGEEPVGTVWASNCCISTAGGTEQFVEIDRRRYGHIVDPRTGLGTSTPLCVTAIGDDGAVVDASDTAAVVIGIDQLQRAFAGDRRTTLIVHRSGAAPLVIGDPARVRWAPSE